MIYFTSRKRAYCAQRGARGRHGLGWVALLLTLVLSLCATGVQASGRIALVIGNSTYVDQTALENPGRDADLIGNVLQNKLGYTVLRAKNADRVRMLELMGDFAQRAQNADSAVFYFSGHGMQDEGSNNYLLPVDARVSSNVGLRAYGINANEVIKELGSVSGPKVSLVILDACRNNPFSTGNKGATKGLQPPQVNTDKQMLVAYATKDGQVAQDGTGKGNSPYARALAEQLAQANERPLMELMDTVSRAVRTETNGTQRPTRYGDVETSTYLVASLDAVPVPNYKPNLPSKPNGGGVNFEDLKKAEAQEKALKAQWAQWLQKMKADYATAQDFEDAGRRVQAMQAFIRAYGGQDDPYSTEDEAMLSGAKTKLASAQIMAQQAQGQAQVQGAQPERQQGQSSVQVGKVFKDCDVCPEMVVLPKGSFVMGSPESESERGRDEGPQHNVSINYHLAVGKYAVTFEEWQACVDGGGCQSNSKPGDPGWFGGSKPVVNVNWNDAQEYVKWLQGKTGKGYRLLSEAEWEYAARAGTTTPFYTGQCINTSQANYDGNFDYNYCGAKTGKSLAKTQPVGKYAPNGFGLYDMGGNVFQWVEDVYHDSYNGAPVDGSAWVSGSSTYKVARGSGFMAEPRDVRSAFRGGYVPAVRNIYVGFRLARTL